MNNLFKSILLSFLVYLSPVQGQDVFVSTSFREPATDGLRFIYSTDGVNWDSIPGVWLRPEVGVQKVMRDPSIVRSPDGVYHMVWTSSWKGDKGFGYASSKDLVSWSKEKLIPVMQHEPSTVNVWAPELFYDDEEKLYYIVWASTVPFKFAKGQEDEYNNHRLYYVTTSDFQTFSDTKLFFDPGYSVIDAIIVKREKKDYVMVFKDNTRPNRNLKIAFAQNPAGPWKNISSPFTESYIEGPTALKLDNEFLIYYDVYRKFMYGASSTTDFQNFKDQTTKVKIPQGHKHGTVFKAPQNVVDNLLKMSLKKELSPEQLVRYTGTTLANPNAHDGQLSPVVGVHNIQTMRAHREKPSKENCNGWTYNHQPMLAYWNGKFHMHFISGEVGEHIPSSATFYQSSSDGYKWSPPQIIFPEYKVPDGYTKPDYPGKALNLTAIMHQRVGFYVSKSGKLLATGNYGIALDKKDDPNDGNGIGRVVREIYKDGTFGKIYFFYYNHQFNEKNSSYPYFEKSKDKEFVKACRELMANPLYRMQMVEEADREDEMLPLKKPYKAFNSYTLPDGKIAALWKHAVTSISEDGGNSWYEPVLRAVGFVNSNAKIWGQKLTDGSYATVYNPSEFRWPLAISTSVDGLEYTTLNLVHGEITRMRYAGNYKSNGPQYPRGIQEGNGIPKDSDLWVSYSVNKEDMWVSRIPVPVRTVASAHQKLDFSKFNTLADMTDWNIYSPLYAPVTLEGSKLKLSDKDPYDRSKVEKVIPATKELEVKFTFSAENQNGDFRLEFQDEKGIACSRIEWLQDGTVRIKGGARYGNVLKYETGKTYHFKALLSVKNRSITLFENDKQIGLRIFYAPVEHITRIVFSTGEPNKYPDVDTPADMEEDIQNPGLVHPLASFVISDFQTSDLDLKGKGAVLDFADFKHYPEYFNSMEDENIVQAIPNAKSAEWMKENIPLFNCPQQNFEEMFYFRWWSYRKHLKNTPVGFGMTEFLVNRSYADVYNLISCAIGHHVYEGRWIKNNDYLDQVLNTWYRGNGGQPMKKMMNFSSWNIDAVLNRFLVNKDSAFLLEMLPDLVNEFNRWENTHRLKNGLYWQGDVQDGMEETISGGRRKKYARPTINSYMYGNAKALSEIGDILGMQDLSTHYSLKADTIRNLILGELWNEKQQFFETSRIDSLAQVREAIGFIPWYFKLPEQGKHDSAWTQLMDENGFNAPFGQTTAERRHPEFRTRGVGKCEWDGAVWPFATAQTLTAMANFMDSKQNVVSKDDYFLQLEKYVQSQYYRGKPYIGEYLDEVTGYWLKGDQERSRYYNHSTFNDLIITGLMGLRPRLDNVLEINPLIPQDKWNWFCLDNVNYQGHNITVIWDKNGDKYHLGKGFSVLVDGVIVLNKPDISKTVIENVLN